MTLRGTRWNKIIRLRLRGLVTKRSLRLAWNQSLLVHGSHSGSQFLGPEPDAPLGGLSPIVVANAGRTLPALHSAPGGQPFRPVFPPEAAHDSRGCLPRLRSLSCCNSMGWDDRVRSQDSGVLDALSISDSDFRDLGAV